MFNTFSPWRPADLVRCSGRLCGLLSSCTTRRSNAKRLSSTARLQATKARSASASKGHAQTMAMAKGRDQGEGGRKVGKVGIQDVKVRLQVSLEKNEVDWVPDVANLTEDLIYHTTCCHFATTSRSTNAGSVSLPFMFVMVASGWPAETQLASDMALGDWME